MLAEQNADWMEEDHYFGAEVLTGSRNDKLTRTESTEGSRLLSRLPLPGSRATTSPATSRDLHRLSHHGVGNGIRSTMHSGSYSSCTYRGPTQTSRTMRGVLDLEQQGVMTCPDARCSSVSTASRCSGMPSRTFVSQVPQTPSPHDTGMSMP